MSSDAALLDSPPPPAEERPADGPLHPARRAASVAVVAIGTGLTIVVAVDGSPVWCVVRALASVLLTVTAFRAVRTVPARRAALLTFAIGLVGTSAGLSLATRFAAKGDWSVCTAGALLAGAVGAMLLIGSAVALVALAHRLWSRILCVLGMLAAMFVVGQPIAVAVAATNVPRSELRTSTPADHGLQYVDAQMLTEDGVLLSGWYVPSENGAAVVLLHGASSARSSVLPQAVVLARLGYGVLLFDARGQGASGGRAMNLGWYGDSDLAAAIDFLERRPDVDPDRIGALGESMGGEEAIGALDGEPRVHAVVAEGATGRVDADLSWLSDVYGVRGSVQRVVQQLTTELTDVLTDAAAPVTLRDAASAGAPRPVLLVAAGTRPDEQHAADHIRDDGRSNVDVWVVPGAGHTGGLRARPSEWVEHVGGFLDASLGVER